MAKPYPGPYAPNQPRTLRGIALSKGTDRSKFPAADEYVGGVPAWSKTSSGVYRELPPQVNAVDNVTLNPMPHGGKK
jgi:hypothetical protein